MLLRGSPESVLAFTRLCVVLVCSWPPSNKASAFEKLRFRVYWWIAFVLLLQLFLPLIKGIWYWRDDSTVVVKTILLSSATAQALIKIIICRYQRDRLRMLHDEMEAFLKRAKPFERLILQRYVDRSINFYGLVSLCIYLACMGFVFEPIILSRPFPTDASYPFPVNSHPVHEILYFLQSVAIFHVASGLFIDSQIAVLLWYTSARFAMLGEEFESASSHEEFNRCIEKHQKILAYASEVRIATRFVALATMATTTIGILCGGLTLITRQPLSVKIRVGNVVINAIVELFVYAWPADSLIEMSQNIGNRAYHSSWTSQHVSMLKSLVSVVHRSQKPVTISVNGFLPALSLNHYLSFLSSSLSYFTTLRVVYSAEGVE